MPHRRTRLQSQAIRQIPRTVRHGPHKAPLQRREIQIRGLARLDGLPIVDCTNDAVTPGLAIERCVDGGLDDGFEETCHSVWGVPAGVAEAGDVLAVLDLDVAVGFEGAVV